MVDDIPKNHKYHATQLKFTQLVSPKPMTIKTIAKAHRNAFM